MNKSNKNKNKVNISDLFKINSYTKSTRDYERKGYISIKKEDIPLNYKILGFIFFFIVLIGVITFYLNPFSILNYLQIPIIIFYIFIFFCVLIFIARYVTDKDIVNKQSFNDMYIRFVGFITSYFYHIGVFIIFAITTYYIYSYFKTIGVFLLNTSLPLTFGLIILTLALFSNYSKNNTIDHPILDLIKDIIMYIPCLITDTIEYLKKDYDNTPSSVFIVFILLVIYCFTFYIGPTIKKEMYKKDGILLIEKSVYLNKNQLNLTTNELNEKIFNNLPFYDRWLQNMLFTIYNNDLTIVYTQDLSNEDISYNIVTPPLNKFDFIVPPDKKTWTFYENFTSLMNQDTMPLTEAYKSLSQIERTVLSLITTNDEDASEYIKSIQDKPEQLKEYVKTVIKNEPYLLTFVQKLGILYASGLATRDGILSTIYDKFKPMDKETKFYHYSISMWVYLNKIEKTSDKQIIMTYGSLPSLYYDSNDSTLTLEYKDYSKNRKDIVLYKTKHVLYQRWNHIVVTYNHGTVDLFINNNMVGNYKNVSPFIYDDDLLAIGSKNNKNIGGVCNVKYYPTPLSANKIQSIYSQFNNKDPPI